MHAQISGKGQVANDASSGKEVIRGPPDFRMDEARAILERNKKLLRDFDCGSQMRKEVWMEEITSSVIQSF